MTNAPAYTYVFVLLEADYYELCRDL